MPIVAPVLFTRLENIPIISAGKIDDAARPKASATVWAAKPGGFNPNSAAITIATAIEIRAHINSCRSEMPVMKIPLSKS